MTTIKRLTIKFSITKRASGFLQIRFRVLGRQLALSSKTNSFAVARKRASGIIDSWLAQHKSDLPMIGSTWKVLIERFIRAKYSYSKASTVIPVRRHLKVMRKILGVSNPGFITKSLFENSVTRLIGNSKPKTWANMLTNCRKFFRWLIEEDVLGVDPSTCVQLPPRSSWGRKTEKHIWSDSCFDALIKSIKDPEDVQILTVLRYTGIDLADLYELRARHIRKDLDGRLMIIKKREKAKSDLETIKLPLGAMVLDLIKCRITEDKNKQLFQGCTRYSSSASFGSCLYKRVHGAFERINRPMRDLKSLRHTFATSHAERGVPMDVLRDWMGHAPSSRILEDLYVHRTSTASFMD